ncbi:MAG TPA: YebC/PmpR family DNA-binding transcriptional regulator [Abditibacteriaceae bacterium]|jgi:YebC/PmpR family DNA-binding regulatory protein
MAGHSKWKNIRLHKGKADAARGKVFAKLSRELTVAAKAGGGSVDSNPRLRFAVDKAKSESMPADNIKRAIQKGTGELASENYEEITYEGYGPSGVAVMVETATDNKNRTVADLRNLFLKNGGNLGESGSVAWQFTRKGQVSVEGADEDTLMEAALEAGAEDVEDGLVTTAPEDLARVRDELEKAGFTIASAELQMVPSTTVALEGDAARKMLKLLDVLEDYDDVQNVAANFDIADDEMN